MDYSSGQNLLQQYMDQNPIAPSGIDYSTPMTDRAGSSGVNEDQIAMTAQYQNWLATLSPQQRTEYEAAVSQHYDAGQKKARIMFAAAVAAMAAPGLMAAAGGGGGGAAGGLAGGLGDATAGMGWMGGAEMGAGAGAYGASAAPGLWAASDAAMAGGAGGLGGGLAGGLGAGGGGSWLSGINAGSLLNLGGNLLSGYMGSKAAGNAADAQLQAGRESNDLIRGMYETNRADLAPYREAGYSALDQIKALLNNPSSLESTPGYKFEFDQGAKALNQGAAARGMTYSGAQGKALQRYGSDYGSTKLNESYNRLSNLAGMGQGSVNAGVAAGTNYANNAAGTMQGMGNVQGSAYIGSNNAWQNAIGNSLNNMNQNSMMDMLLRQYQPKGP